MPPNSLIEVVRALYLVNALPLVETLRLLDCLSKCLSSCVPNLSPPLKDSCLIGLVALIYLL